jgi:transposase
MSSSARSIIYLGLDVHKDSITIAVLPDQAAAPERVERLPNDLAKVRRWFTRFAARGELRACYEASGAGYVLHRALRDWGHQCDVIAPSLIPKRPGVQRKHDKRDAVELARLYRAGELTPVRIPTEGEERVRDLVRCRETFQRELLKSRHYILKFLARRGFVYRDGAHWSRGHMTWLHAFAARGTPLVAEDAIVFREYLSLLEYKLARRTELDSRIEALALTPAFATPTGWLQCFRGLKAHSAMVLTTEIVDWRRFESPRQLMAYLGFVPREHSSGDRERRGGITKAGNSHCRHVLLQAAWSYRHPPQLGTSLKARQRGQPAVVIAHAWKAQHRLYKRYHRIAHRRPSQIAVVAVARELIGFLWAAMRELDVASPAVA